MTLISKDSPCRVELIPDDNGGLIVTLFVPTYSAG